MDPPSSAQHKHHQGTPGLRTVVSVLPASDRSIALRAAVPGCPSHHLREAGDLDARRVLAWLRLLRRHWVARGSRCCPAARHSTRSTLPLPLLPLASTLIECSWQWFGHLPVALMKGEVLSRHRQVSGAPLTRACAVRASAWPLFLRCGPLH